MNRSAIIAILAFLLIPQAIPASEWFTPLTNKEVAAQAVFTGLTLLDWNQTLQIARHPEEYSETNPVLGEHPSVGKVNTLMSLGIVSHAFVTWAIPKEYRPYWQYIWIGIETQSVHMNWQSGLRINF